MAKQYKIKTVDGSRFEFIDKDNIVLSLDHYLEAHAVNAFVGFPIDNGIKYFNLHNVVSITEQTVDE